MPSDYARYQAELKAAADAGNIAVPNPTSAPVITREAAIQTGIPTTASMTAAQQIARVLQWTPGGAVTVTTRTGTEIDAAIPGVRTGDCFYQTIQNLKGTSSHDITLSGTTGCVLTGDVVIDATDADGNNATALLRYRRVGENSWTVERMS